MKYIALHHTAVSRFTNPVQLYAVDRYHQGKWGMRSKNGWYVGYNVFGDADGSLTNTRQVGEETIAQKGHNCDVPERCDTISYCMAGDFNRELPSDAQIETFKRWYSKIKKVYPDIEVVGHGYLQAGRSCPGALMTKKYIGTRLLESPKWADANDMKKKRIALLTKKLDLLRAILRRLINKNYV